jgi:hypothetical protein
MKRCCISNTIFKIAVFLILVVTSASAFTQEALRGLAANPQVTNYKPTSNVSAGKLLKSKSVVGSGVKDNSKALFFDDFSASNIFPDTSRWYDSNVFINSTYPIDMVSIGAATFDALDDKGFLYSNASTSSFEADRLTSRAINLAFANKHSNDLFLSFFYQPQGIGEAPDAADSLKLQFLKKKYAALYPIDELDAMPEAWEAVWGVGGSNLVPFRQVLVQVTDSFQYSNFRFRFSNLASLSSGTDEPAKSGNVDLWHVDYIKLDTSRNAQDTVLGDIAIVKPMTSLLKSYTQMPWSHFNQAGYQSLLKDSIFLTYRNNDSIKLSVIKSFEITNLYQPAAEKLIISAGNLNIDPNKTMRIGTDLFDPFVDPWGSPNPHNARFLIKAIISDRGDVASNNTVSYIQEFKDCYAYDDSTAEAGWGLLGQGSQNASVAYAFRAAKDDAIYGVSIYFNPTYENVTQDYYFKLSVWGDSNGKPGTQKYIEASDSFKPRNVGLNKFFNYKFAQPVAVSKGGTFYVGWQQVSIDQSDTYLNIGFDRNTDNHTSLFYNLDGTWRQSTYAGSLMVRPYFGDRTNYPNTSVTELAENKPLVYPNPASDRLYIGGEQRNYWAVVYNIQGCVVLQKEITDNQLGTENLPNGIYILKLVSGNTTFAPIKLLIQH